MRDGEIIGIRCRCIPIRESLRRLEESGLQRLLETQTFDNYRAEKPWQQSVKETALRFVEDHEGKWLFAGGQVGSGKTHICTAVVGELLRRGNSARYMLWRDEAVKLRACVNDDAEYSRLMRPLKMVDVLYIDDFLKTEQNSRPTPGDINVAFELINARYADRTKTTLFSSEKDIDGIMAIDEAIGSRIYERAKEYCLVIGKDPAKNYRLQGGTPC